MSVLDYIYGLIIALAMNLAYSYHGGIHLLPELLLISIRISATEFIDDSGRTSAIKHYDLINIRIAVFQILPECHTNQAYRKYLTEHLYYQ
jgi:hypothetical protein